MSTVSKSNRLIFVDQYRGLIMVLMALDHTLYFWCSGGRISNEGLPLLINGLLQFNRPQQFTGSEFIIMLLSSLAAPGFLFLSGYVLSRSLNHRREMGMTSSEITRHLMRRGLTLIFLQILIISPAFNFPAILSAKTLSIFSIGTFFSFSVLSTIGTGLIFLALVQRFSPWIGLLTTLSLYAGEQLYLPLLSRTFPALSLASKALVSYFLLPVPFDPTYFLNQNFPVIPWLVPISLGWLFGETFKRKKDIFYEDKRFIIAGSGMLFSFLILRINNVGDYLPFDGSFSSFFVLSKYPPSPDYLLFYMGIMFVLFYFLIQIKQRFKLLNFLENFGQVPLFFYLIHLWVYSLIPLLFNKFNVISLKIGLLVWILGLIVLYSLCKEYNYKHEYNRRNVPIRSH